MCFALRIFLDGRVRFRWRILVLGRQLGRRQIISRRFQSLFDLLDGLHSCDFLEGLRRCVPLELALIACINNLQNIYVRPYFGVGLFMRLDTTCFSLFRFLRVLHHHAVQKHGRLLVVLLGQVCVVIRRALGVPGVQTC